MVGGVGGWYRFVFPKMTPNGWESFAGEEKSENWADPFEDSGIVRVEEVEFLRYGVSKINSGVL